MSEISDLDDMVQPALVRRSVTWPRGGRPSPRTMPLAREALRLREQGMTFRAIGERLGVSDVYAHKLVRKVARRP